MHWINQKGHGIVEKSFSIAPFSSLTPVYIRIDNTGLKMFNNDQEIPFTNLFNEKAEKICKSEEIGRSFQTDGTQAILQYIESLKLRGSKEEAEESIETK